MKFAVIDLGTNSVRFGIYRIASRGRAVPLYAEKRLLRLGDVVFSKGKVSRKALKRLVDAFSDFRSLAFKYQTSKIIAVATSALREASNTKRVVREVHDCTGIRIKVISGEDEARLIAKGVLQSSAEDDMRVAIVDIGGGSTEISICKGNKIIRTASFRLGAARLAQELKKEGRLDKTRPPSPRDIEDLRRKIRKKIASKLAKENWPGAEQIIGSSGTIKTIVRVCRKPDKEKPGLKPKRLKKRIKKLCKTSPHALKLQLGDEHWRSESITAAAVLLEEISDILGAQRIITSKFSLRDGILREQILHGKRKRNSPRIYAIEDVQRKNYAA